MLLLHTLPALLLHPLPVLLLPPLPALRRWAKGGYERQDTPADRVGEVSCRS